MTDLTGKTALVTGSTSGIGLAIATELANAGADVMLNGFGEASEIEQIRAHIAKSSGRKVFYSPADMSKPAEIEAMIVAAKKLLGGIDILVNNAGIQHVCPVEEFPIDKWNAIIAINLSSSFHTIRMCLSDMKNSGWGRIINLASAHSLVASPYKSAYVAAKHGIAGLTKTIALECAQDGVTVNAISPGYVLTPLVEKQIPDTAKARNMTEEEVKQKVMLAAQPTKDFISVEQVSQTALFLCSEGAKNITGSNLSIDGGWTAQ